MLSDAIIYGNFETKTSICYPHGQFDRLTQITDLRIAVTDTTTGARAVSEALNITDP
ncbi:hypothetical protein [Dictyobacter aurantiacus]|uniref:Uncharacterized protein n=1 Tax=Dictyobacter aurantiacus TaxID=1936993 RepID=A0A401ZJM3_9CHLR|nr:hypothetical protein [Dictyobacter aurantiacus]GCE07051.1 hypothetical protein KDAU_43800 [Dictyobacter aurantiacus]